MSMTHCDMCGEPWYGHGTACKQITVQTPVGVAPPEIRSTDWLGALRELTESVAAFYAAAEADDLQIPYGETLWKICDLKAAMDKAKALLAGAPSGEVSGG